MFLLFMPWGLISGFLAVNALLTFIMVPYASDPVLGVSYRGKGDACFIKALFSPGIVLYPCIIQKKNSLWGPPSQRQADENSLKMSVFVQYLHNLTVSVEMENTRWLTNLTNSATMTLSYRPCTPSVQITPAVFNM